MSCCFAPDLSAGVCVKRYGPRLPIKHDYFDKDLSRKGAAPATGRDTLIKLQGRVARKLDTHASENRLAGLPPRITRITLERMHAFHQQCSHQRIFQPSTWRHP